MAAKIEVQVEGRRLQLSNLDKPLYPNGFRKAQVIDYYTRIAPAILPHLRGRPLTLKRYPDGVDSGYFYEKNCPKHRPAFVQTVAVYSHGNQRDVNYCVVDDLPSLVWAANLASLELHTSLSRGDDVARPTMLVLDLDPGPPATIVECCRVALWAREILDELKLVSLPKTSGSKGLQLYIPLNTAVSYDVTKTFARTLARQLEHAHGDLVVSSMKKELRRGKVLVDWSQNDDHKTTVSVYSLRARERPTASTPVRWEEVEGCAGKADPALLVFDSDAVLARVEKHGDLFEPVLRLKQSVG